MQVMTQLCPLLRFAVGLSATSALFIIHLPVCSVLAGKNLQPLVMIAASYCPVSEQEVINELFISEFCSCSVIEEECPVPRPSVFFCNCHLLVLSCYVGVF